MIQKADLLLILIIILASGFLWFGLTLLMQKDQAGVMVMVDGEDVGWYDLDSDISVTLSGYHGGYNLLLISGGRANMIDADCPDRFCVKQKSISMRGESIICLPHRLVVRVFEGEEGDIDAVSY